jgi:hypothetical protein
MSPNRAIGVRSFVSSAVLALLACASLGAHSAPKATAPKVPITPKKPIAVSTAVSSNATPTAAEWSAAELGSIDPKVFELGLQAAGCAVRSGDVAAPATLTVIDYSRPSTAKRMWVYDLRAHELLHEELVAHGQGSGGNVPTAFSNTNESHQSSLGLFVTKQTYSGKHGLSLRLDGLERGVNDRALERAIVIHGAAYVSEEFARAQGRLGRSWGCPAVRKGVVREIIDDVKDGGLVFAYYPDDKWLQTSEYLSDCRAAD